MKTELLTPAQACEFLHCSIPTLNKHVDNGDFNKYTFPNSHRVYFKKSEILEGLVISVDEKKKNEESTLNELKLVKKSQKETILHLLKESH